MFNTRKLYVQIHNCLLQFVHSIRYQTIYCLPEATRDLNIVESFTNQLNFEFSPISKLHEYSLGNHIEQIYHARLRTGYSTLKLHLYSKRIIENTLYNCEIEDPYHFVFECHQYNLIGMDRLPPRICHL